MNRLHELFDVFLCRLIALVFFWQPLKVGRVHRQLNQELMWIIPVNFNGGNKFSATYRDFLLLTSKDLANARDRASRYFDTEPDDYPKTLVQRALWPLS